MRLLVRRVRPDATDSVSPGAATGRLQHRRRPGAAGARLRAPAPGLPALLDRGPAGSRRWQNTYFPARACFVVELAAARCRGPGDPPRRRRSRRPAPRAAPPRRRRRSVSGGSRSEPPASATCAAMPSATTASTAPPARRPACGIKKRRPFTAYSMHPITGNSPDAGAVQIAHDLGGDRCGCKR